MAAERTPSRRKQCIFRRTLQRFPFGKCERRSGGSSSSSYDIHHSDKSPYTPGKWSPTGSSTSVFSSHQPGHGEGLDSGHHMNSAPVSLDTIGQQDSDSVYSSTSITEDGTPLPVESPPSPSTSSMEMDVGVDPETGERAMD